MTGTTEKAAERQNPQGRDTGRISLTNLRATRFIAGADESDSVSSDEEGKSEPEDGRMDSGSGDKKSENGFEALAVEIDSYRPFIVSPPDLRMRATISDT